MDIEVIDPADSAGLAWLFADGPLIQFTIEP